MEWYYVDSEEESQGPVPVSTLKSLYASKAVTDDTAVWNESMTDWVQISTLPDLKKQLAPAVAKPPPMKSNPTPTAPTRTAAPPSGPSGARAPAGNPSKTTNAVNTKGGKSHVPDSEVYSPPSGKRIKTRTGEAKKTKVLRKCAVNGCSNESSSRGYCSAHANEAISGAAFAQTQVGCPDMVLLTTMSHNGVARNLKERHASDQIYTYIGHVLVAVNPYKWIRMYEPGDVGRYTNKSRVDVPPHIFATAEACYRNMLTEEDNQCVIISGESGAGKTEASKHIQQYIAAVSGGGPAVDLIKQKFLESNPLLESFGNAKTIRNNNSSRFGKYFELIFDASGRPQGGKVTNYLLEKSRVVKPGPNERGYHIFYQLISGATDYEKEQYGIRGDPREFSYLEVSNCYTVDKVDDSAEFADTRHAMTCMGISEEMQFEIFGIVAAVLHLGNIDFKSSSIGGADGSVVLPDREGSVQFAAFLLQVDPTALINVITNRKITVRNETTFAAQNPFQASGARDAMSKALYARLFDRLVETVNKALDVNKMAGAAADDLFTVAVLDIFGFEIFNVNGFEQFCINYVNEKLQQIFIRLTLKGEQEEYEREGIHWDPIDFFNNEIVCTLIDSQAPPGCLAILDDTCKSIHGQAAGIDDKFLAKLNGSQASHPHYSQFPGGFQIQHYAGPVQYTAEGFCESNKDLLFDDMRLLLKSSGSELVRNLFPEDIGDDGPKKAPTTAGFKIRKQCEALVDALMDCEPHYVRCLKSNDEKKPNMFDVPRVEHQVTYLGLLENIRVRRAGFAYRAEYHRFLKRFRSLCPETWPVWLGNDKDGSKKIIAAVSRTFVPELGAAKEVQYGSTKIFIRQPETFFALEQAREKQQSTFAGRIQNIWKKFSSRRHFIKLQQSIQPLFNAKKERRKGSIFRPFVGDYVRNETTRGNIRDLISSFGESERPVFLGDVDRIVPSGSGMKEEKRIMAITDDAIYLMEEMTTRMKDGSSSAKIFLRLRVPVGNLLGITLTPFADDYFVLQLPTHVPKKEPVKTHIVDKRNVKTCMRCSVAFSMMVWKKICNHCGGAFCNDCTLERSTLPTLGHYAPVRICSSCHGKVATAVEEDILFQSYQKTEIVAILADIYEGITGGSEIPVSFQNNLNLRAAPVLSEAMKKPVIVEKDSSVRDIDKNASSTNVRVAPGVPLNIVQSRQRRRGEARERREALAQQEREARKVMDEHASAERDALRRQRIADKKSRKEAERMARKRGDPNAGFGASAPSRGGGGGPKTTPMTSKAPISRAPAPSPPRDDDDGPSLPKPNARGGPTPPGPRGGPTPPSGPSAPRGGPSAPKPAQAKIGGGGGGAKFKVASAATSDGPPCRECGCGSYAPHMFKKGYCMKCNHEH